MMINNSLDSFVRIMLAVVAIKVVVMLVMVVMVGFRVAMVGFRVAMVVMQLTSLNGRKWSKCNILMYGI